MTRALDAFRSARSLWIGLVLGCSVYDPSLLGPGTGFDPASQAGQGGQAGDVDPTGVGAAAGWSENGGGGLGDDGGAGVDGATTSGAGGTGSSTTGAAGSAAGAAGDGSAGIGVGGAGGDSADAGGAGGSAPTGGCSAACLLGSGCPGQACWIASAHPTPPSNYRNLPNNRLQPPYAIDGNEATRYTTGDFANGNEWFQVDLCRTTQIAGLTTYTDTPNDVAASYNVQVSVDGSHWVTVLTSSSPAQQRSAMKFAPVLARFVRYNQTGTTVGWWSLGELSVICAP
jgi:hypothetical protein